jgi:hypothetical protein
VAVYSSYEWWEVHDGGLVVDAELWRGYPEGMKHRLEVFDLTTNSGRSGYEELVNRKGVQVEETHDFFGLAQDGSGGSSEVLTRVVDAVDTQVESTDNPLLGTKADRVFPLPLT